MEAAGLSAPVAILKSKATPKVLNPNTGAEIDPSFGLPVEEVEFASPVKTVKALCTAIGKALDLNRTRVSYFTAKLDADVFAPQNEAHVVDTLLDQVKSELNLKGFIGLHNLSRDDDIVTLKVVLIDAHRHSDK